MMLQSYENIWISHHFLVTLALPKFLSLGKAQILLTLQVRSGEKRLEKNFGQEYLDYKNRVGRYFAIQC